jgi:hypothetical protein
MFPMLRIALRIQDMLILLAIGCVLLGIVYLVDQFRAELRKSSLEKTNFTPWHAPHFHFLTMALMVGLTGVFAPADQMLDWQLYDTYFVISLSVVGVMAAAYLLFVSLVYFMARRLSLLKWMAVMHLVLTVTAGILFYLYYQNPPEPTDILDPTALEVFRTRNAVLGLSCGVAVVAQVLLPINLLIGLWRRR